MPALAAQSGQSLQPLVVESASAVTVYPAPAMALQGVWSQSFVPLCCSCLFSSFGAFSAAFCHLGLSSHTILLLFLWRLFRLGFEVLRSWLWILPFWGGGGGGGLSLSLVLVVLAWLLQLFSFCPDNLDFLGLVYLGFFLSTSSVSLVVPRKL